MTLPGGEDGATARGGARHFRSRALVLASTALTALSSLGCGGPLPGPSEDMGSGDVPDASVVDTPDLALADARVVDLAVGYVPPDLRGADMWQSCKGFGPSTGFAAGQFPDGIVAVDLNKDGHLDIAVTNERTDSISFFFGYGDGNFKPAVNQAIGIFPTGAAAGDLNGDGLPDLVVGHGNGDGVDVLLNILSDLGVSTFSNQYASTGPESWPLLGDVNHDGKLDLVAANFNAHLIPDASTVTVNLGDGKGKFGQPTQIPMDHSSYVPVLADFNGDGNLDIAVSDPIGHRVVLLAGDGKGGFAPAPAAGSGLDVDKVFVADVNGDGAQDLILNNAASDTISVLLGNGKGAFGAAKVYPVGHVPFSVAIGDLNLDGKLDLAVCTLGEKTVTLLFGKGDGTFAPQPRCTTGSQAREIALADVNGDGRLDIALTTDRLEVLLAR